MARLLMGSLCVVTLTALALENKGNKYNTGKPPKCPPLIH
jgi:hypothetical protein